MKQSIFIGRMQPFHSGHYEVVKQALEISDRLILILGCRNEPRTLTDPFTLEERVAIIRAALSPEELSRVVFASVNDVHNDHLWRQRIIAIARNFQHAQDDEFVLIGHHKDESSSYLNLFTGIWEQVEVNMTKQVNATDVRAMIYDNRMVANDEWVINPSHFDTVCNISDSDEFVFQVVEMHEHSIEYRDNWGSGPFITCDAVVTYQDQVLLVQRSKHPYKGLWALPGGFLEPGETTLQGTIRELREETGLVVLPESRKSMTIADSPKRDPRARIVAVASHFDLNDWGITEVEAGDDAAAAQWFPLSVVEKDMKNSLAFDHYRIIESFL